jgi:CrcB protein
VLIKSILFAGSGGFIGVTCRYLINFFILKNYPSSAFPIGTTLINILGCVLIGFFVTFLQKHNMLSINIRLFLIVGILGGFTTFSAFGFESLTLLQNSQMGFFALNVFLNVVAGIFGVYLGSLLGKIL